MTRSDVLCHGCRTQRVQIHRCGTTTVAKTNSSTVTDISFQLHLLHKDVFGPSHSVGDGALHQDVACVSLHS